MMSMSNFSILQFTPPTSNAQRLSVLVIGSNQNIEVLKPELLHINQMKYSGRLHLQFSVSIEEIKTLAVPKIFSDFIAVIMDPKDRSCIGLVEDTIAQIDPTYLCGRLCLVNSKCDSKPSEWRVQRSYFKHITDKYQLNLINGDIMVSEKCAYLAERILITATTVCGYKTGNCVSLDPPQSSND